VAKDGMLAEAASTGVAAFAPHDGQNLALERSSAEQLVHTLMTLLREMKQHVPIRVYRCCFAQLIVF
jgi:hypothetical protein